METKICTKCGEENPATKEFFHAHKTARDGLKSACKVCRRKANNDYRSKNLITERARSRKWHKANLVQERKRKVAWYRENVKKAIGNQRKRNKSQREELQNNYVKGLLCDQLHIARAEITPLDIKEKRRQIQCHREIILLTKQLKQNGGF